ncbi:MAG: hypothetical protein AB7K24_08260, partial [Gemmataceae bacterium]
GACAWTIPNSKVPSNSIPKTRQPRARSEGNLDMVSRVKDRFESPTIVALAGTGVNEPLGGTRCIGSNCVA